MCMGAASACALTGFRSGKNAGEPGETLRAKKGWWRILDENRRKQWGEHLKLVVMP